MGEATQGPNASGKGRVLAFDSALIVLAWLAAVVLVDPRGNFPLNDDWSYGRTVEVLMREGIFRPSGWTVMSLLSQVLWGALFCLPFGFSFDVLRLSTLLLSLAGVLVFYSVLKLMGSSRSYALLGSLVLAFNPLYFALSSTFMTDVPFTSLTIFWLYAGVLYLKERTRGSLLMLVIISMTASLCRETGVLFALVLAGVTARVEGVRSREAKLASLPLLASLAALTSLRLFLFFSSRMPVMTRARLGSQAELILDPARFIRWVGLHSYVSIIYLGLFIAPILLLLPGGGWTRKTRSGLTAIALGLPLLLAGKRMPLAGNVLIDGGIGPVTLRDVYLLGLPHYKGLAPAVWITLSAIGVLAAAGLLQWAAAPARRALDAMKRRGPSRDESICALIFFSAIAYAIVVVTGPYFDRYLLPLLPLVLALSVSPPWGSGAKARAPVRGARGLAGSALAVLILFSVTATHDYLAWNRARWQALGQLMEKGVRPEQIDGGFEFNGWYNYSPDYRREPEKSWWWVEGDEFLLTMGPVEGYEVAAAYAFRRWLPPGRGRVYVLRRRGGVR